jgi:SAM-dependent methyltransferase
VSAKGPDRGVEHRRVGATYRAYATDPGAQRRWSSSNPGNRAMRAELMDAVLEVSRSELAQAREVLDVGCGTGWWLEALARRPEVEARLHGVDVLAERVERARRRVPAAGLAVADARQLPYAGERFSIVTMFTVLSSLASTEDAQQAIREAWRVLTPAGLLLIWEPRVANPLNRHTILISRRDVRRALGGVEVRRRTLTLLPPVARALGDRTPQLYPRLARVPLLRTHQLMWARGAAGR